MALIDDLLIQAQRDLSAREVRIVAQLLESYGVALGRIERELRTIDAQIADLIASGGDINEQYIRRQRWWREVEQSIQREMGRWSGNATQALGALQSGGVTIGVGMASEIANAAGSPFQGRVYAEAFERWVSASQPNAPLRLISLPRYEAAIRQSILTRMTEGIGAGKAPRAIVREILRDVGIDDPESPMRGRLLTLARTETMRAFRGASADTMGQLQERGVVTGYVWLAKLDGRTCPACVARHGQISPTPWDQFHPSCFPAGTVVNGPLARAASKRWYEGELVEIVTASGQRLSVTPNHPILTSGGWVAAGELHEGDDVLCNLLPEGPAAAINPNYQDKPLLIEDVAESLASSGPVSTAQMPISAMDFHGDGSDSEVEIVFVHSLLGDARNSALLEPLGDQEFFSGNVTLANFIGGRPLYERIVGAFLAAHSVMRLRRDRLSTLIARLSHPYPHALGSSAGSYPGFNQVPPNNEPLRPKSLRDGLFGLASQIPSDYFIRRQHNLATMHRNPGAVNHIAYTSPMNSKAGCDLVDRLSGSVSTEHIIRIKRIPFHGYVYNLETQDGWYIANNTIVHNCRCVNRAIVDPDLVPGGGWKGQTGPEWFAEQDQHTQRAMLLSDARYAAYRTGTPLSEMVSVRHSDVWGDSIGVKPLAAMPEISPAVVARYRISPKKPLPAMTDATPTTVMAAD